MKYKYILLSLLCLLFCSGCSVEYNLDIDNKLNFNEVIIINSNDTSDVKRIEELKTFYPVSYDADKFEIFEKKTDGVEYYDVKKSDNNSKVEFVYNYDINSYNDNVFAKNCYEYVTLMNFYNDNTKRDELVLSTSSEFLCFDNNSTLDDVTVKIKTKRKVYDTNADKIDKNTYVWNINKDNKNEKPIVMSMESSLLDEDLPFWERNIFFIIVVGLIIVGLIVYFVISRRSKRVDKI